MILLPASFFWIHESRLRGLSINQAPVKDPICGKDVTPSATRGGDYLFEGAVYHFCEWESYRQFGNDARKFINAAAFPNRSSVTGSCIPW